MMYIKEVFYKILATRADIKILVELLKVKSKIVSKQHLANELHKPIIRKFKVCEVYSSF